ncbi:MAG: vitamin K epoxide reductase family protein [bacterium]
MTTSANASHEHRSTWRSELLRHVQKKEIRRQIAHNRVRKAGMRFLLTSRARARTPALLPEYAKVLLGSALGLWIITWMLSHVAHAAPLYTLTAFGFFYSAQASYYTYRLSVDPAFRIPRCGCAGATKDDSEVVLRSGGSGVLKVPSAALGAVLYAALAVLAHQGDLRAATGVAMLAVSVSAYLGYLMVVRISALCSTCINVASVNLLILWQLVS